MLEEDICGYVMALRIFISGVDYVNLTLCWEA